MKNSILRFRHREMKDKLSMANSPKFIFLVLASSLWIHLKSAGVRLPRGIALNLSQRSLSVVPAIFTNWDVLFHGTAEVGPGEVPHYKFQLADSPESSNPCVKSSYKMRYERGQQGAAGVSKNWR